MEYILIQDDDCHWYVIPADKRNAWNEWLGSEDYYNGGLPEYANLLDGGPADVKFKEYRIK